MITLLNLSMGFSQRTLFKDVSLSIFPNEKIGLTGPNGAGKTTLFSIILGQMEPVAGQVQIQKNINIGYLPQETQFSSKRTVMQELTEGDDRIKALLKEKRGLEETHQTTANRYGDVLNELELLGIYELENKAEKILMGLGFKQEDFHRPIEELSGGWQMRTLLARLLTYDFDILLLDEPTNYLDLAATLWLKEYLAGYQGAFVLISHDRVFLNDITNYTIILEGSRMQKIKGNYESYEYQRDIDIKTLEKRKKVVDKKRQQLERFAQRFHAQPNRASAVKNKRKMIEKLEQIDLPQDQDVVKEFEFSDIPTSGYVVCRMEDVSKSYGDKKVYQDLNLEIVKGQKVCLVGPNGAGKSTLLKMLAGAITQDSGFVKYGHGVEPGYFSQSRLDVLNPNRSAFDEVISCAAPGTPSVKARSLLGLFNFVGDDVFKLVKVLSGGEKSRLILAKLLINPPNFMLLDEPTTHLDLAGVQALTRAFKNYSGTVCFISHDLYFIREIADQIIDIQQGQAKIYPGGLDYYLGKSKEKQEESSGSLKTSQKKLEKKKNQPAEEKQSIKNLHQQHKKARNRISQIKKEIDGLIEEKKSLETESYVKSRHVAERNKDNETLKDYSKRLKVIQSRLREIESELVSLDEEKRTISK